MKKFEALLLILLIASVFASASTPLSAGAERSRSDLSWHVLSAGGQGSASPAHQVRGTLGQLAIGPAAFPGGHTLGSGYWYGIVRVGPQPIVYEIYLPILAKGAGR